MKFTVHDAEFKQEVRKFGSVVKTAFISAKSKWLLWLTQEAILRTPVDTGNLRFNWQPTAGQPSDLYIFSPGAGAPTPKKVKGPIGANFYLTNNTPYGTYIENDRRSAQAPDGIIGPLEPGFGDVFEAFWAEELSS